MCIWVHRAKEILWQGWGAAGREVCGKKGGGGINVTVLNSAESHWTWTEEEDVEESCNNRGHKSRGHKSYDWNWAFSPVSCCCCCCSVSTHTNINHDHFLMREHWLSSASFGVTPFSWHSKGLWRSYVPVFNSYSGIMSAESCIKLLMTGSLSYYNHLDIHLFGVKLEVITSLCDKAMVNGGFPSGEALLTLKVAFTCNRI